MLYNVVPFNLIPRFVCSVWPWLQHEWLGGHVRGNARPRGPCDGLDRHQTTSYGRGECRRSFGAVRGLPGIVSLSYSVCVCMILSYQLLWSGEFLNSLLLWYFCLFLLLNLIYFELNSLILMILFFIHYLLHFTHAKLYFIFSIFRWCCLHFFPFVFILDYGDIMEFDSVTCMWCCFLPLCFVLHLGIN